MKYLRTYENIFYNEGDYVIVTSDDERLNNDLAIIIKNTYPNELISVELPDYVGEYLIYPHEIIKKLSPEEVEAIKYNL
jgi:hypothetical protein